MSVSVSNRLRDRSVTSRIRNRYLGVALARRRFARQLVLLAIAAALGLSIHNVVEEASRSREAWGRSRMVVVASRTLDGGHVVGEADLRVVSVPEALVPVGALTEGSGSQPVVRSILGRRIRSKVEPGEMLTRSDLAEKGKGSIAAALGEGRVAITVRLPTNRPPIELDDSVDVFGRAGGSSERTSGDQLFDEQRPVKRLAVGARVLRIDEAGATLLIPAEDAGAVLNAESLDDVALVITG